MKLEIKLLHCQVDSFFILVTHLHRIVYRLKGKNIAHFSFFSVTVKMSYVLVYNNVWVNPNNTVFTSDLYFKSVFLGK